MSSPVDDRFVANEQRTSGVEALIAAAIGIVTIFAGYFVLEFLKNDDANKLIQVLVAIVFGVVGVWALYWSANQLVGALPRRAALSLRPWVFVLPAMAILAIYLVYPAIRTLLLSVQNSDSTKFVGFDNYRRVLTENLYLRGIGNSLAWVIVVPAVAVAVGLVFAALADKLSSRTESVAKSLIFLPMAISLVGASVVFGFIYKFRAEGFGNQIGLLNAAWTGAGGSPIDWLKQSPWNNVFLMVVLIWLQTGFAMVILSSGIKSVPEELLEAARIDGASEWQIFWKIIIPTIASTITVVWTTIVITVWKVFDVVYVMTGGNDDTQVIAQQMVTEFFKNRNNGIGSALAVLLFVAVIPILVINVRRFKAEEAMR